MNLEDIKKVIAQKEGIKTEFKSAENVVPKSMYETVVSFSNTDGGIIVLGVDNNGNVIGINSESIGKIQTDIVTALNNRYCVNPPLYLQPEVIQHPSGVLIALQIPASSQVHDHSGKIFIRKSEADIDITGQQSKIASLYHRKRTLFSEGQIYDHLGIADLDEKLLDKARTLIRNYRSDHPWLLTDNLQMLKDSILWKKDFAAGKEGYTLAAALIFGKDRTIQSILPAYKVEAMVRIKNKDRWDDRITLRTNLIDTYLQLKEFINKHLPEKFYMEGDQRIDLRDKIFREVIGNVVVHREYTSALSTDMVITENVVIFTNPNKPLFHGPLDPSNFNPYAKNPNIRKFFTAFGWTDEIGSGIRNTNKYLPLYTPEAKPVFIENDTFRTEIPLRFSSMAEFAELIPDWLGLEKASVDHLKSGLVKISLSSSLLDKSWKEVLIHLVPSWHEKGTQLMKTKWLVDQPFIKKKLIPVPSSDTKGTQLEQKCRELFQKKSWYLLSILILTAEPINMSALMDVFEYKNVKSFRDNYIKPLRSAGLIRLTIPDTPTDPANKYVLTERGKHFLSGTLT